MLSLAEIGGHSQNAPNGLLNNKELLMKQESLKRQEWLKKLDSLKRQEWKPVHLSLQQILDV
jgi:hypothetical protein